MSRYSLSHYSIVKEREAYQAGRLAAMTGKKNLLDNPHKEGSSLYNAWESGFLIYKAGQK